MGVLLNTLKYTWNFFQDRRFKDKNEIVTNVGSCWLDARGGFGWTFDAGGILNGFKVIKMNRMKNNWLTCIVFLCLLGAILPAYGKKKPTLGSLGEGILCLDRWFDQSRSGTYAQSWPWRQSQRWRILPRPWNRGYSMVSYYGLGSVVPEPMGRCRLLCIYHLRRQRTIFN